MMHPIIEEARPALVKLLKREEGLRLKPYLCSAGVPTIGVGATTYPDGTPVRLSDPPITEKMAMQMLAVEADRYMQSALEVCKVWPTVNQLCAMASLAYNIGVAGFKSSSVARLHNRGDHEGAARAFNLWNQATVKGRRQVLPGLVARRAREAALYLTPSDDEQVAPVPQAVASESRLAASPIAASGASVTIGGTALGFAPALDGLQQASQAVDTSTGMLAKIKDTTMMHPSVILGVLLVIAGAVIVWQRYKQRSGGWA